MYTLIIVNSLKDFPLAIPGVEIVTVRSYLTEPRYSKMRNTRVYNLCRSYRYQSNGYYVSLLAEARGHKPLPHVSTILDMKSQTLVRFVSDDLDRLIQKSLATIKSDRFTLSIYFGKNLAKAYDRLAGNLFKLFPAPFLRAQFVNNPDGWQLQSIRPIAASEIPEEHRPFVIQEATEYFSGSRSNVGNWETGRYALAILYDPAEQTKPSNEKAIQRFVRAAESLDMDVEIVTREDYGRIAEFDALFIRETTAVNHHTFRFARRAKAEGLVVIDDPDSILKCTNKVYLAELMDRHRIPQPRTEIVHSEDQIPDLVAQLGLPMILKQPDSSFSQGVVKVSDAAELAAEVERLFEKSDLVLAQQFMPTPFDWRIGVLDGQAFYACRYYMAPKHWQIINHKEKGDDSFGDVATLPIEAVPEHVLKTAVRAANLIGNGLYGVDLKEVDGKAYVIEVNDNPSLDAGFEDAVLKEELYLRVMRTVVSRIDELKNPAPAQRPAPRASNPLPSSAPGQAPRTRVDVRD